MGAERNGLLFHSHYAGDRARRSQLDKLIEETFDLDLSPLIASGFEDPNVVPFSYFDGDGRCVANASVYPVRHDNDGVRSRAGPVRK